MRYVTPDGVVVRLLPKSELPLMRAAGLLLGEEFLTSFWTTYRLPFCTGIVAYPSSVVDPFAIRYEVTRRHEFVHAKQQQSFFGLLWSALLYFFIPLPFFLSGRWFVEREAFLVDISHGRRSPESVADLMWRYYFWPWPRRWMVRWLTERAESIRRAA